MFNRSNKIFAERFYLFLAEMEYTLNHFLINKTNDPFKAIDTLYSHLEYGNSRFTKNPKIRSSITHFLFLLIDNLHLIQKGHAPLPMTEEFDLMYYISIKRAVSKGHTLDCTTTHPEQILTEDPASKKICCPSCHLCYPLK